ncbi:MAG: chorismate mutase [Acidimicrobiia bacterium]
MAGEEESLRQSVDRLDREIVRLLAHRLELTLTIGHNKAERGLPVRSPEREAEVLATIRREGEALGLDGAFVEEVFRPILEHSRSRQEHQRALLPDPPHRAHDVPAGGEGA